MTAHIYPDTNSTPSTENVFKADAHRVGAETISMKPEHRTGETVDKVDQVSSVTLLSFAVFGSVVMLGAHWMVG